MNKEQKKTERNSIIQTAVFSVFSPFVFIFAVFSFFDIVYTSRIIQLTAEIFIILIPILYYCIVMRPRRNDVLIDSHDRRIKISLIIQIVSVLVLFFLPLGYMIFFTRPEEGHWGGEGVLLIFASPILPVVIHIGGCIVKLFVKLLRLMFNSRI